MAKHKVTLWPSGQVIEVDEVTPLLKALKDQGVFVKSSCGGVATCGDCKIKVAAGMDQLNAPTFGEMKLLGNVFHLTKERLSCQVKVLGDVTIDITEHDQSFGGDRFDPKAKAFNPPKVATKLRKKADLEMEQKAQAPKDQRSSSQSSNKGGQRPQGGRPSFEDRNPYRESKNNHPGAAPKKWFKHWEKNGDAATDQQAGEEKNSSVPARTADHDDFRRKKLGGNKRPRAFNYSENDSGDDT